MGAENIDITIFLRDKITNSLRVIQAGLGGLKGVVAGVGSVLTSFQAQLAAMGVTLAAGALTRQSVMMFAEFDDTIRAAAAAMRATKEEFKALSDAAKDAGMKTRYSASQAAEGLKMLGYSGMTAEQSIAALPRVLMMAAAGGLQLGDAAGIATGVMNGFRLTVEDLPQITDVLTHTFTSSNSTLLELGEGFKMVGSISASTGGDFEELMMVIGRLHDNQMKGTSSGTALRAALSKMLNPAGDAEQMMEKLNARIGGTGLQVRDASGNFIGWIEVVKQLEKAGLRGDEALRLFGEEAGPAMAYLVGVGSEALQKFLDKTRDVGGVTDKVGKQMEGGLGGALRELSSSFEAVLISAGEAFGDDLIVATRKLTEYLINLIGTMEGLKADGTLDKWKDNAISVFNVVSWAAKETAAVFNILGKSIAAVALVMTGEFRAAADLMNDMLREDLGLSADKAIDAMHEIEDRKRGVKSPKKQTFKVDPKTGEIIPTDAQGKVIDTTPSGDVAKLKAAEEKAGVNQKIIGRRTQAEAPVVEPAPQVKPEIAARAYGDRMKADIAVQMTQIEILYDQSMEKLAKEAEAKGERFRKPIAPAEMAAIQAMYDQGLKTISEFYTKKEDLLKQSIESEVQVLQKQFSSEKDVDKRANIDSQIYSKKKELEQSLLELAADRIRDEIRLEEDKLKEIDRVNQNRIAIEQVFSDIKARVVAGEPGLTEAKFQQEIFELQERHNKEYEILVNAEASKKEFDDLSRQQELEKLQVHEDQARAVMNFRLDTAENIAGGMSQLFDEMYQAGGEKNKELFYASKALAIAEATIKTSQAIIGALGSPPYGMAAMATAAVIAAMGGAQLAKIMSTGLAEGGRVPGHSPHAKADNIVARLTADEFVQPVSAVKYYGLPFMEAVRTLSIPRENVFDLGNIRPPRNPSNFRYSFAEGGSVKGAPEPSQSGAAQQNFDIVNVVDKSVFDQYLGSTVGKKALMNVIRSNAYELKNAMAAEM